MASANRPTLTIIGVDRDRSYFFWQWVTPRLGPKRTFVVEPAELDPVLNRLRDAMPIGRAGEGQRDMLTRILTTGALAVPEAEHLLSSDLRRALLPDELASEIAEAFLANGREPLLIRLMPSAATASVPWELFPVMVGGDGVEPEEFRLIELADIVREVPAGIHAGRARLPIAWSLPDPVLYVVDAATRAHGPVLDGDGHDAFRSLISSHGHHSSKVDDEFTRRDLSLALVAQTPSPPTRLFYVGHVVQSVDAPGSTSMLLSDSDDTFGVAPVYHDVNRPLSAMDLFEGTQNWELRVQTIEERDGLQRRELKWPINRETRRAGARIWPMPSRVALVACNSGSDLAHAEPFGLAIALINAGAELVTATKWTLPTDHAYRELLDSKARPLLETALALDGAHASTDPVRVIAEWQREQLAAWRSDDHEHSAAPLLWAAFSTYVAVERVVESILPRTDAIRLSAD